MNFVLSFIYILFFFLITTVYSLPHCTKEKSVWGNMVAYCSCDQTPASIECFDFSFPYWDFPGGFEAGYLANTNCQDYQEAEIFFEKYPPKLLKEKPN